MNRFQSFFKTRSNKEKILIVFFTIFFILVGMIKGTTSWTAINQRAVNAGQNIVEKKSVYLQKFERGIDGKETIVPISGAVFYLYRSDNGEVMQIGGRYTTDDEGIIPLIVTPGEYYFEEISPSTGYTYDKDENGESRKKYPFTVTRESSMEQAIVVAYNQRVAGSLEITKNVQNKDGSMITDKQRLSAFTFIVTFSDQGTYKYKIDNGEEQTVKSGETIRLKHGQKAIFIDIPVGVHYIVEEEEIEGYQISANNSSGTVTIDQTTASFLNTYDKQVGTLTLKKEIVNEDGSVVKEDQVTLGFIFDITFSDDSRIYSYTTTKGRTGTIHSGETVTVRHGEALTFFDIPYGVSYSVNERHTEDYTASPAEYKGTIQGNETVLPFINQYHIDSTAFGSLAVKKQVVAEQIDEEQLFDFYVTFSDNKTYDYKVDGGPVQSLTNEQLLQLKSGQTARFLEVPAGTTYHIVEKEIPEYKTQLKETTGTILSNQESSVTFYNHRQEKSQLIVKKIGKGEGFDSSRIFTFHVWINGKQQSKEIQLKEGESSNPIELSVGDTWRIVEDNNYDAYYSQTELLNGTGVVTHANQLITVTQTNTYVAPVMIDLSGQKTWSIPEGTSVPLPQSITVHLKDGETTVFTQKVTGPDWTYKFQVPKYNIQGNEIKYSVKEEIVEGFQPIYEVDTLNITNVYRQPAISRGILIEKRLVGEMPEKEETFDFRLSPGNEIISIQGAGTKPFIPQPFTAPGTYTYTITERDKGTVGYTYDPAVYTWTVVVVEQEDQLVIQSEKLTKDGEPYVQDNVVFENQYKPSIDEKVNIKGVKKWNHGSQLVEDRPKAIKVFLRANGNVVYQKEVRAEDNWSYSFIVNARDNRGEKIDYTIDEEAVPNYTMTVDGYDLVNTYTGSEDESLDKPSSSPNNNEVRKKGNLPSTGEVLGILLIVGSVLIVVVSILLYYKNKKNTK